ncbi:MAG: helix-turn-helix transcriptional regulator [Armatimonadetes bacterium]|nr:helix-turn-helix transcriptional regulator [Armatimonadota bacterium]
MNNQTKQRGAAAKVNASADQRSLDRSGSRLTVVAGEINKRAHMPAPGSQMPPKYEEEKEKEAMETMTLPGLPREDNIVARLRKLSPREREVLDMIAAGLSSRDTARSLFCSKRTVDYHLYSIYRKLGVSNRVQAVLAARAAS